MYQSVTCTAVQLRASNRILSIQSSRRAHNQSSDLRVANKIFEVGSNDRLNNDYSWGVHSKTTPVISFRMQSGTAQSAIGLCVFLVASTHQHNVERGMLWATSERSRRQMEVGAPEHILKQHPLSVRALSERLRRKQGVDTGFAAPLGVYGEFIVRMEGSIHD